MADFERKSPEEALRILFRASVGIAIYANVSDSNSEFSLSEWKEWFFYSCFSAYPHAGGWGSSFVSLRAGKTYWHIRDSAPLSVMCSPYSLSFWSSERGEHFPGSFRRPSSVSPS